MLLQYRFLVVLFGLVSLASLTSCSTSTEYLDKLQTQIQEEVVKQGGNSLKSVICSAKSGDKPLQCVGVLDSGSGFDIEVQQRQDKSYDWKIPSVKGLLNMSQIQTAIQTGLKQELGEFDIDCGGAQDYKAAKPGESFECQLKVTNPATTPGTKSADPKTAGTDSPSIDQTGKQSDSKPADNKPQAGTKTANQPPQIVVVTVLPTGDVSWQRILPTKDNPTKDQKSTIGATDQGKPDQNKTGDNKSVKESQLQTSPPASPDATEKASPAAAKSADDFLNQSGATDDF